MDAADFVAIEQFCKLEDREIYRDFEEIVGLAYEAVDNQRKMTSVSLPEGFVPLDDADEQRYTNFGFQMAKDYGEGRIEVEYGERSSISIGEKDSSNLKVRVEPLGYSFVKQWEHDI